MHAKEVPGTVKGILRYHAETTTVKGVPKILRTQKPALKCLWLFAVLLGGSVAFFQLISLLITFFSHPTTTKVKEVQQAPEYPDVTLCNLNPLTKTLSSNITPDDYSKKLLHFAMTEINVDDFDYFDQLLPEVNLTEQELLAISSTVFSASGYYQSFPFLSLDINRQIGDIAKVVFTDCVFYSWDMSILKLNCDQTTVKGFFYPEHFLCFTISIPPAFRTRVKGLSTIMYLHQEAHATFPFFKLNMLHHKSTGLKVVIHPRNTVPDLIEGDTVAPGHETTIRVTPTSIELLPHPYGECVDKKYLEYPNEHHVDPHEPNQPYFYTSETCRSICYQEHVIEQCGCIDPVYSYTENQIGRHEEIPFCGNTTFIEHTGIGHVMSVSKEKMVGILRRMTCSIRVRQTVELLKCSCPRPCEYNIYDKSYSQTPWPTTDHQLGFVQRYINGTLMHAQFSEYIDLMYAYFSHNLTDAEQLHDILSKWNKLERNFLQINVLLANKRYEVVSEHPVVTWDIILANMGGMFNLWIGVSFITLIELLELVYRLVSIVGKNNVKTQAALTRNTKIQVQPM